MTGSKTETLMDASSALPETLTSLLGQVRQLYHHLSAEKRKKWARDLPFEDLLLDRWDRARTLGFGAEASIYQSSYVYGDVKVGAHTWVGPFTLLDGSGGLEIGAYCSISAGVHIYSHNTVKWAVSGGKASYERRPVRIGDCCFIGPHSVIRDGVTLGDHVVVGAHRAHIARCSSTFRPSKN